MEDRSTSYMLPKALLVALQMIESYLGVKWPVNVLFFFEFYVSLSSRSHGRKMFEVIKSDKWKHTSDDFIFVGPFNPRTL